jgi:hypothetical protein
MLRRFSRRGTDQCSTEEDEILLDFVETSASAGRADERVVMASDFGEPRVFLID